MQRGTFAYHNGVQMSSSAQGSAKKTMSYAKEDLCIPLPLHTIICIPFCILFKNCMQDRYKRMRCNTDEKNKRMGFRIDIKMK